MSDVAGYLSPRCRRRERRSVLEAQPIEVLCRGGAYALKADLLQDPLGADVVEVGVRVDRADAVVCAADLDESGDRPGAVALTPFGFDHAVTDGDLAGRIGRPVEAGGADHQAVTARHEGVDAEGRRVLFRGGEPLGGVGVILTGEAFGPPVLGP